MATNIISVIIMSLSNDKQDRRQIKYRNARYLDQHVIKKHEYRSLREIFEICLITLLMMLTI